jgi:hypothetical protein
LKITDVRTQRRTFNWTSSIKLNFDGVGQAKGVRRWERVCSRFEFETAASIIPLTTIVKFSHRRFYAAQRLTSMASARSARAVLCRCIWIVDRRRISNHRKQHTRRLPRLFITRSLDDAQCQALLNKALFRIQRSSLGRLREPVSRGFKWHRHIARLGGSDIEFFLQQMTRPPVFVAPVPSWDLRRDGSYGAEVVPTGPTIPIEPAM